MYRSRWGISPALTVPVKTYLLSSSIYLLYSETLEKMSDLGQVTQYSPSAFIKYHKAFTLYDIVPNLSKLPFLQNTKLNDARLVTTLL